MEKQDRETYAHLDRLSTRQLEELLLADLADDSGRDNSQVVFHILEVLRSRENEPHQVPATDQAWERFQRYYNTPEGKGQSLYPCGADQTEAPAPSSKRPHPSLWRTLRVAAAAAALLLALMVGAQASGLNVFGALAQWTSETFHFGSGNNQSGYYELFLEELGKNDIPENYAPTRFPSEFEASEPKVLSDDFGTSIQLPFYDKSGNTFSISLEHYNSPSDINSWIFEKDLTLIESYTKGDMTFYILSNIDATTATWVHGTFSITIWGVLSTDEVKLIIDSIGGI